MIIGTATNGGWLSGLSKKVSQYIKVEPIDLSADRVSIHNKYDFLNLDFVDISGDLTVDDKVLRKGILPKTSLSPHIARVTKPA